MKALRWHRRLDIRVEDVPIPELVAPDDVILAVEACGLCGSDVEEVQFGPTAIPAENAHPLTGKSSPVTLGHEIVGWVVAAGKDSAVDVGERVVPTPVIWCGECPACVHGDISRCEVLGVVGLSSDGGLAEFVRVQSRQCVTIDDGMPTSAAVMVEPYAVALHALKGIDMTGTSVAVVGFGSIGACVADVAIADGADTVIAIDPNSDVTNRALANGLDRTLRPEHAGTASVQLVIEASGAERGLATAVEAAAPGGTVIALGIRGDEVPVSLRRVVFGELTIVGRVGHDLSTLRTAAVRLHGGEIGQRFHETKFVDLDAAKEYLTAGSSVRGGHKVIVNPRRKGDNNDDA